MYLIKEIIFYYKLYNNQEIVYYRNVLGEGFWFMKFVIIKLGIL